MRSTDPTVSLLLGFAPPRKDALVLGSWKPTNRVTRVDSHWRLHQCS